MLPHNLSKKPETPPEPPKKIFLVLAIFLIVVGLAGVIATVALSTHVRNQPAQELAELQKDKADTTGLYAKVTAVHYYQFLSAYGNSTENYFFITDPSDRAYIVRISTDDAQAFADTIADGYAAEMYGILHELSDGLKEEAVNAAQVVFENPDITLDNCSDYFGSTYLGFAEIPTHPLGSVFGSAGTFLTIIGMMVLIFYMNRKLRAGKALAKK